MVHTDSLTKIYFMPLKDFATRQRRRGSARSKPRKVKGN